MINHSTVPIKPSSTITLLTDETVVRSEKLTLQLRHSERNAQVIAARGSLLGIIAPVSLREPR